MSGEIYRCTCLNAVFKDGQYAPERSRNVPPSALEPFERPWARQVISLSRKHDAKANSSQTGIDLQRKGRFCSYMKEGAVIPS